MTSINTNYAYSPQTNNASSPLEEKSAAKTFLEYMDKTPEERMIDQILNELGVTREEMEAMTPEERRKLELKIEEKVREKVEAKVKG